MRQTSINQSRDFGIYFLDDIVSWVQDNLDVDDVFEMDTIKTWAESYYPEDIFSETELEDWAKRNGFTREEK